MSKKEIMNKLQEIYQDVFCDETIVINDELSSDDIEEWDSLTHLRLIMQVEKCFHIKFTTSEMKIIKNAGILANLIFQKVN